VGTLVDKLLLVLGEAIVGLLADVQTCRHAVLQFSFDTQTLRPPFLGR
jgi:hypothetical protein